MTNRIYAARNDTERQNLPITWTDPLASYDSASVPLCLFDAILAKNKNSDFTPQGSETPREAFTRKVRENLYAVIAGEHECGDLDPIYQNPDNWDVVVLNSEPDGDNWVPATRGYAHPLFQGDVIVAPDGNYQSCKIYYHLLAPTVLFEHSLSVSLGAVSAKLSLTGTDSLGERSRDGGQIVVRFAMEEVVPIDLRVTHELELTRVAYDTWTVTLPAGTDVAEARVELNWFDPYKPVRIVEARFVLGTATLVPMSLLEDYRSVKKGLEQGLSRQPTSQESAIHQARLCWIAIDLATSLDQIDTEAAAKEIGFDAALYAGLDARAVEALRATLEARWRARAAIFSSDGSPGALLPPVGHQRRAMESIARCIRAIILKFYSDVASFWKPAMLWACGRLRGRNESKLNTEPNSAAIASFAELFDIAGDQDSNLTTERRDCRLLRVIFASLLEPYFETYCSRDAWPRQADLYRRKHLKPALQDPRWDGARIDVLIWVHEPALHHLDENEPWVEYRWGQALAAGLRDELRVRAAGREPHQVM